MNSAVLKAPFPYFGGKGRVSDIVWRAFGDVPNYIEPFAGSLAVLLGRPHAPKIETVNDKNGFIANFWRALQADADGLAAACDWPVNEADLHARHLWLIENASPLLERLVADPDYFDVKVAGWWVWGLSQWIGSGWCDKTSKKRPQLGSGMGVHRLEYRKSELSKLSARLRRVRVCCGDWSRVVSSNYGLSFHGGNPCAVFLDPPYSFVVRKADLYATDCPNVGAETAEWARAHGDEKDLRIALCGYEDEHEMPASWTCVPWKSVGTNESNANRERIWFSPSCLPLESKQSSLFEERGTK